MIEINKVQILGTGIGPQKIRDLLLKANIQVCLGNELSFVPEIIIEAVPGTIADKREALLRAAQTAPAALLATNVAGGVTELAAGTGRASSTIGMYFIFNPFEEKCLAQIVRGLETSAETAESCRRLLDKTSAVSVTVEDSSGLIVDRVMASVVNEAAYMLQTGLASMEDINQIPRLCLNWPIGPFEFADLIGLDKFVATLEAASRDSPQYLPCRLLREMVLVGRLGKKSGKGFYDYTGKTEGAK